VAGYRIEVPSATPRHFSLSRYYSITVEAPGFKKFVRENLVLSVGDTVDVDVALEVGAVTEELTVAAESPLLETAKADRGTPIDQQSVAELPLNGRNPFMLAKIVAGVNFNGTVIYQRPFDNGAIAQWTINGGLYESNEFLLDGSPNNAQAGTNNMDLLQIAPNDHKVLLTVSVVTQRCRKGCG
jgi:hypothetical protein